MTPPPDRLQAMIAAHRRVRRPPPGLRERIAEAIAEPEETPRAPSRWLQSVAISVGLAAAALLLLWLVAGPRGAGRPQDAGPREQAVFGQAEDADDARTATEAHRAPTTPKPAPAPELPATREPAPAPKPTPEPVSASRSIPRAKTPRDDGSREARLLREAELALTWDPADALRRLQAHQEEFPKTTFGEEREALFILAMCRTTATAAARTRQTAFLREHPHSSYAARVRAACSP